MLGQYYGHLASWLAAAAAARPGAAAAAAYHKSFYARRRAGFIKKSTRDLPANHGVISGVIYAGPFPT